MSRDSRIWIDAQFVVVGARFISLSSIIKNISFILLAPISKRISRRKKNEIEVAVTNSFIFFLFLT